MHKLLNGPIRAITVSQSERKLASKCSETIRLPQRNLGEKECYWWADSPPGRHAQAVLRTLAAQQQVQKKCTLLQLWERWRTSKAGDDAKLAKGYCLYITSRYSTHPRIEPRIFSSGFLDPH